MAKQGRVPGMLGLLPDLRTMKLGVDNNRLSALIAAILDAAGGTVTLTKEQSEKVWKDPQIHYRRRADGGLTLSLSAVPEPDIEDGVELTEDKGAVSSVTPKPGIRQPEV